MLSSANVPLARRPTPFTVVLRCSTSCAYRCKPSLASLSSRCHGGAGRRAAAAFIRRSGADDSPSTEGTSKPENGASKLASEAPEASAPAPASTPAADTPGSFLGAQIPELPPEPPAKLPGEEKSLQLPKEVIERLKTRVFGIDTFFVTSVDNYEGEGGVVFKGNVRGRNTKVHHVLTYLISWRLAGSSQLLLMLC